MNHEVNEKVWFNIRNTVFNVRFLTHRSPIAGSRSRVSQLQSDARYHFRTNRVNAVQWF